jgi:hypothetical protein
MYALWILFWNFKTQTSYRGKRLLRGLLIWVLLYTLSVCMAVLGPQDPEDEGAIFLLNVRKCSPNCDVPLSESYTINLLLCSEFLSVG